MMTLTTSEHKVRFRSAPSKKEFVKELRRRADHYFTDYNISPHANTEMYLKTAVCIVLWLGIWGLIISDIPGSSIFALYTVYMLLGFVHILIAFNIMHDATHNAYSPNTRVNKILGYSMDFIGGNQYLFRQMHGAHHGFVNVYGIDVTLESHGLFRFSPEEPWQPRHRYQHIYTFLLYAMAMLQWVTVKDFKWFFGEHHIGNRKNIRHPLKEYVILFAGKIIFYSLTLFIPIYLISLPWYTVAGAWIFMHVLPGLTFALIFQVTHIYEGTSFPKPDENGNIDNNYALHVLETTADFSRHNRIGSWLMGGINIHVIHHIFPKVCHVHYPALTKILTKTCEDFGITYQENTDFITAVKKHYQILKRLSLRPVSGSG